MIEQILATHSILVKIFLGFLVLGIAIPFMTAKKPLGFRKASFIYTMIFQAIATMIAFTGLIGMVIGEWDEVTILYIFAALLFMFILKKTFYPLLIDLI